MIYSKYGNFDNFKEEFSPIKGVKIIEKFGIDGILKSESTPTLVYIKKTYGDQNCISLVSTHLMQTAIFYGNPRATAIQFYDIATLIISQMPYLKISELILFFHLMKSGEFRDRRGNDKGKMYGNFNGEVIMDCLHDFKDWRFREITRIEQEQANENRRENILNAVADTTDIWKEIWARVARRDAEIKSESKPSPEEKQPDTDDAIRKEHEREFYARLANEQKRQ